MQVVLSTMTWSLGQADYCTQSLFNKTKLGAHEEQTSSFVVQVKHFLLQGTHTLDTLVYAGGQEFTHSLASFMRFFVLNMSSKTAQVSKQ